MTRAAIAAASLVLSGPALADLSGEDLSRYGFGGPIVETVRDSRAHETPGSGRADGSDLPALPSLPPVSSIQAPRADRIPPPPNVPRVIHQGTPEVSPYEGATRVSNMQARDAEGTFQEVEEFFFRPSQHFERFLSTNESHLTGLNQMYTGEVDLKGRSHGKFGVSHTQFRRSFGQSLIARDQGSDRIEQLIFPLVGHFVPGKDLELSVAMNLIDEEGHGFPLISDFSLSGIRDVTTRVKYRFLDNPEDRVSMAAVFGIHVGVEPDVTRLGSNGVDYEMAVAFSKRVHNVGFHLDGGWLFANGQNRSNSRVPDVGFAGLGLDFQTGEKLDWILEARYTDFQNIGQRVEITPALKVKVSRKWRFDLGIPFAMRDTMAQGFFYRIVTGFQFRF